MTASPSGNLLRIGIDIGGTFTDFVTYDPASHQLDSFKLLSTPGNPAQAVLAGLDRIADARGWQHLPPEINLVHGSTVSTNALLERKGARTAFIATRGFRDLLAIGRQNRPDLYTFTPTLPEPLAPEVLRFEVAERISSAGEVLEPFNQACLPELENQLHQGGAESVAVCLLFSFLHPAHEVQIAEHLRAAGFFVSVSSEILPEFREYERASTTAVNAYVSPILDRYLTHLEQGLMERSSPDRAPGMLVMQSNGGSISLVEARRQGVRCILSGPAGGVVASRFVAQQVQEDPSQSVQVITFDMGGTSTDVSLIDGEAQVTSESVVGGCPIRIPVLDIHTIGAGGGSLAALDAGGALRVGPHSAGANPGPACYGLGGDQPTVTDANLVLGRLSPERFLGGAMHLDEEAAWQAVERLGQKMGLDPVETALGIIEVANTHMERALRVISVERGYDPQNFSLLSFGGAGGLHAADLARRLGIRRVLVPPLASTLSAFGMLAADIVKDYTLTVMLPGDTPFSSLEEAFSPLEQRALAELTVEGFVPQQVLLQRSLDIRYRGQSYELPVPTAVGYAAGFHAAHRRLYGYDRPESALEIVNLRLKATGAVTRPVIPQSQPVTKHLPSSTASLGTRRVVIATQPEDVPVWDALCLEPGTAASGPALLIRPDTVIFINSLDVFEIDQFKNIWMGIGYAH